MKKIISSLTRRSHLNLCLPERQCFFCCAKSSVPPPLFFSEKKIFFVERQNSCKTQPPAGSTSRQTPPKPKNRTRNIVHRYYCCFFLFSAFRSPPVMLLSFLYLFFTTIRGCGVTTVCIYLSCDEQAFYLRLSLNPSGTGLLETRSAEHPPFFVVGQ